MIVAQIKECIKERRMPYRIASLTAWQGLVRLVYRFQYRLQTSRFNRKAAHNSQRLAGKSLYASPVGASGKEKLAKIIKAFGHERFDYIVFSYDATPFKEDIFRNCKVIPVEGYKWMYAKKHLTPEVCQGYDYIFYWDDDIDVGTFSFEEFLDIMKRNHLEMAQPALSAKSYKSHDLTAQDESYRIGKYTDFVEVMVPVFTNETWNKFWQILEKDEMGMGWGYDYLARSLCRLTNLGIVDSQCVHHLREISSFKTEAPKQMHTFFRKNVGSRKAVRISYAALK